MATRVQVVMDCADPAALAGFWAEALRYTIQDPPEGFDSWEAFLQAQGVPQNQWNAKSAVIDPDGVGPRLFFQRVPEAKSVKNRVHLDLNVSGSPEDPEHERARRVDDEVERLRGLGATTVRDAEEMGERWVVMQDPEGNEFCVQ